MWVLGGFSAFILAVVIHAVSCRLPGGRNSVVKFLCGGVVVGAGLAFLTFRSYGFSPETVSALLVYGFACEVYTFLFTLAANSVSASLLVALLDRVLTQEDISSLYRTDSMVERRLKNLVHGGFLTLDSGAYRVTFRGICVVAFFGALRQAFRQQGDEGLQ